jgi:hypothetical protein
MQNQNVNNGFQIGPHLVCVNSKKGKAYLRAVDTELLLTDTKHSIKFSLDPCDSLFLSHNEAHSIVCTLRDADFDAFLSDINAIDENKSED